ncbi:MAG TPA: anti-sigma factor [Gemmatimonadaceae bacterium]|nr:anti-sigma factor [Gemmatimonadaceae bacterium]
MTDTWTDRLSEYVDDELDATARQALEAHLATCAECRATVESLRRVVARARSTTDREPQRDLWTPIRAEIDRARVQPLHTRRRLVTVSIARLLVAAGVVALLAGGVAWGIATRRAGTQVAAVPERDSAVVAPAIATPVSSGLAAASYRDAAADLERVLEAGRSSLKPETMRVIEANLRAIDVAIAQADSALRQDPGSEYLNQYLAATMQRKLKLLRRAVAITTARS